MQHDFRHAARHEDLHGRMIARAVGQRIDQPRHLRFTSAQSSTVGRRSPAACAIAGMCRMRFVEPPNAACTTMRIADARRRSRCRAS